MSKRSFIVKLGTALALIAGSSAQAQSTAAPNRAVGDADANSDTITEIVVTATRRSEGIQHVPQSVSALSGADLSQLNAKTLGDFAGFVPGLSVVDSGPTSLIVIRGVTDGSQLSSTVGLYLDEVPLGASTQFGTGGFSTNPNAYDLNRVEVLNGPQGTLFGAGSLGGTVRYITAAPDLSKTTIKAETEISSTEHGGTNYGVRGTLNLPLSDQVALRVAGVDELTSGFIDDPAHGRSNQGQFRTQHIRASLLAKPTDNLEFRVTGLYQRSPFQGNNNAFLDKNGNPTAGTANGRYQQSYRINQPGLRSLALGSAEIDLTLPFAKLSSITSYQRVYSDYDYDQSLTFNVLFPLVFAPIFQPFLPTLSAALAASGSDPIDQDIKSETRKFNQEIRLASTGQGSFDWIIGAYYDYEKTADDVKILDLANPGGTVAGFPILSVLLPSTYREEAIYGNATLHLTSKLSLGGGIRYSRQQQGYAQTSVGFIGPGPATANSKGSVTTWSINPRYQATPDLLFYGRVATGFRPGGPNLLPSPGLETFKPDKLTNYEVGFKSSLLDHRATFNLAAYQIDWKNIQLVVNIAGTNNIVNGGDARVRGAEGAFTYQLVRALRVGGTATYTDAKLTTAAPFLAAAAGTRIPFSPKLAFALNGSYSFPISDGYSGVLTVTDRFSGERNAGFGTAKSVGYRLPSYNTVNVDLALSTPHNVEFDLYAHNLTNSYGRISAYTAPLLTNPASPVEVLIAQPRTIGVVAKFEF